MAEAGSWDSIRAHGLRSTTALLDLFKIEGAERDVIESARRPEMVRIEDSTHGVASIRDNKPIREAVLAEILDGCTVTEFYRLLNAKVFFWPTQRRLETLLGARAYRSRTHTIITVDTAALVERHASDITLSRINSGATLYDPPRRGPATFQTIEGFATHDARKVRRNVAEVAVSYAVPDITAVAVEAYERDPDGAVRNLWQV